MAAATVAEVAGAGSPLAPSKGRATAGVSRRSLAHPGVLDLLPLALVVVVPVLDRGGFTDGSRSLFAGLALLALGLALARDDGSLGELARRRAIAALGALAILSAASAAWTLGDPGEALGTGFVIAGLAATALLAGRLARRPGGLAAIAALIAALAVAEAVLGLVAAGLRAEPFAQRIGGAWRPGGTFEYAPALALLQVSALPVLLWAMARARPRLAVPAASGAALAGATVVLAGGRVGIAMALAVLAVAVLGSRRVLGVAPTGAAVAAAVPAIAGLATELVAGGYQSPALTGADRGVLVAGASLVLLAGAVWAAVRLRGPARLWRAPRRPDERSRSRPFPGRVIAGLAAACLAAGALGIFLSDRGGPAVEPSSDITHGRVAEWRSAASTALDHPLGGAGAGGYARAARESQGGIPAIYPHSLPLETWAELGPAGLALIIGLYASVAALLWRLRRDPRLWLVGPAVVAFGLVNLVDWPWHLAGAGAVWALALGACLALRTPR